jgi:hypothetical protein
MYVYVFVILYKLPEDGQIWSKQVVEEHRLKSRRLFAQAVSYLRYWETVLQLDDTNSVHCQ